MPKDSFFSERLKNRDRRAFTDFVRKYEHSILRIAVRITRKMDDAEEVRQKLLLNLWQNPSNIPQDDRIPAWIRRCTVNASIDQLRNRERQPISSPTIERLAHKSSPEVSLDEKDLLDHALSKLTPQQRGLVSLRFDEHLTVREIANTLNKPHTTIQSQLGVAIDRLRAQMVNQSTENNQ